MVAHHLEAAGIATTSISLIREHTQGMRPPRALWVPFSLGRPFGVPNDTQFQSDVLRAALQLLERTDGPVILEDYPHDAPATESTDDDPMFCPVAFKTAAPENTSDLLSAVRSEMQSLAPWYAKSRERQNGRTTVGVSGLEIDQALQWLEDLRQGEPVEPVPDMSLGQTLRFTSEDLRAWYSEAVVAQPAANPDPTEMANWYWGETAVGRLLLALQPIAAAHDDEGVAMMGKLSLVPRSQLFRLES
jgi:hypothetical protein